MEFRIKIWKNIGLLVKVVDTDPSDKKVGIGIYVTW